MKLELKKEFILLAVVLAVYEPILKGAGNLIFNVGLFGLNAYGDYLIRRAALMTPPDISLYIIAGGLSFFLGRTLARIFDVIPTGGLIPKDLTKKTDALVDRKKLELCAHCVVVLVTSYIVYSAVVQTRLISSFRQNMAAIAPYISEDEEELIESRWTQMLSEQDYTKIFVDMKVVADKNGVKLTPNRVFDLPQL